jgi:transglutaminase-like putative cysteine protease
MNEFLQHNKTINWRHPDIVKTANNLRDRQGDEERTVANCFQFVRDEIQHSGDHQRNPITNIASDVLEHRTGYCYAKSHLLAALIRANKIPAGLCYQRLTIDNGAAPFSLHGLNAVYLKQYGWFRIDARGDKPTVDAPFTPPLEQLAFSTEIEGELDLPEVWSSPLQCVVDFLETVESVEQAGNCLPDIVLF